MPVRPFSSSVGMKVLIAVTGLALVGFLVMHLAGNLLIFAGPDLFNQYSHALINNPLIIPVELGLLAIFLAHIYKAGRMWLDNRRARPVGYAARQWAGHTSRKSVGSSTMIYTGLVIVGFVVLHLRTFKFGAYYQAAETGYRDLHRLVLEVFSQPLYVVFYVTSMALIGLHLRHGFSSAFQSLGVDRPGLTPRLLQAGIVVAIVIAGGFALIPVYVYFAY
jgi:succinate dehydrogenase / fumarate reductase, cytochrome b subunit